MSELGKTGITNGVLAQKRESARHKEGSSKSREWVVTEKRSLGEEEKCPEGVRGRGLWEIENFYLGKLIPTRDLSSMRSKRASDKRGARRPISKTWSEREGKDSYVKGNARGTKSDK